MARSGSAGHFCSQVQAGCMACCVRPRKTHLQRAIFCSFSWNTLIKVALTGDLCVRTTSKIKPQKELAQDISNCFFWIDDSELCGLDSAQRETLQSSLYGYTDCGWRRQATPSLGLCFSFVSSTEKGSLPVVFSVLGLCLRLMAFVTVWSTAVSPLPDLATSDSLRYMCSVQRYSAQEIWR